MEKINNNEMQVNDNFNINENRDMFYDMLKQRNFVMNIIIFQRVK